MKSKYSQNSSSLSYSKRLSVKIANIARRQSSLTDLKEQIVALLSAPVWIFGAGVGILFYVTCLNVFKCDSNELIANGYTDPDLHKAVPHGIWYLFMFSSVIAILASQSMLSTICACIHPDISLTRSQYLGLSMYSSVTLLLSGLLIAGIAFKSRQVVAGVVVVSLIKFTSYTIKFNCRRYDKERGQISARSTHISWAIMKFGLVVILGHVVTSLAANRGFFAVQQFLKEALPQDGSFSTTIIQGGGEVLFISCFFLVWRPVWLKQIGKAVVKITTCYNEDLSKNQGIVDQAYCIACFSGDLLFLIFGRGLLLDMSGALGFVLVFLVALKANVVHIWNYGFRYTDEIIILTLKMCHPAERQRLDRTWNWIANTLDNFLRLNDLPRQLSVMMNIVLDYRDLAPVVQEEPTTICVTMQIINFKMRISNLPQSLDGAHMNDEMGAPSQTRKKPTSKWLYGTKTHPARVSSTVDGMDPSDIALTGCPAFPHFPVTEGEKVKLRSLSVEIQASIFQRYQNLALAKLFCNFLFLGAPCAAFYTDTRYLPGFRSPLDDSASGWKYLAVGIFFMVTDIVEWLIITFGFYYRYEGFHEQLVRYRKLLVENKWVIRALTMLSSFLGGYWFRTAWDPYSHTVFAKKFPEMNLDNVFTICKPFFRE